MPTLAKCKFTGVDQNATKKLCYFIQFKSASKMNESTYTGLGPTFFRSNWIRSSFLSCYSLLSMNSLF